MKGTPNHVYDQLYKAIDKKDFYRLCVLFSVYPNIKTYALDYASQRGKLSVVKELILLGANVKARNNSAVIEASRYNHLKVVKYLVSKGASVTAQNNEALNCASLHGHLSIVKFLVSKGANVKAYDNSAIKCASQWNNLEVVRYLVSKGADVNSAIQATLHDDIILYLVSVGADFRLLNIDRLKSLGTDELILLSYKYGFFDCAIWLSKHIELYDDIIAQSIATIERNKKKFYSRLKKKDFADIIVISFD